MRPLRPRQALTKETLDGAARWLAGIDPTLGAIYESLGPPPLWYRRPVFATLSRIVLEQQVSLAAAKSTFQRLKLECGGRISAASISRISDQGLATAGVSRQKIRYIRGLADAVRCRRFSVARLADCDDEQVRQRITGLLGFGDWSADVYLMMALLRPDVLPLGDLGLVKGLVEADTEAPGRPDRSVTSALAVRGETWRPFRSVATRMIWQHYLVRRGKDVDEIAAG